MNSDGVRSNGGDTLVNIEIEGIWRRITITPEAIYKHLLLSDAAAATMSADQRCDFVRSNLAYIFSAVRRVLNRTADARRIILRSGEI